VPAIIALADDHPDAPKLWCGYEPNPVNPGGGCHRWESSPLNAVEFCTTRDAYRSGVGAPNTPYGRLDTRPDRGVKVVQING
jgi:hypothetical protein